MIVTTNSYGTVFEVDLVFIKREKTLFRTFGMRFRVLDCRFRVSLPSFVREKSTYNGESVSDGIIPHYPLFCHTAFTMTTLTLNNPSGSI